MNWTGYSTQKIQTSISELSARPIINSATTRDNAVLENVYHRYLFDAPFEDLKLSRYAEKVYSSKRWCHDWHANCGGERLFARSGLWPSKSQKSGSVAKALK